MFSGAMSRGSMDVALNTPYIDMAANPTSGMSISTNTWFLKIRRMGIDAKYTPHR